MVFSTRSGAHFVLRIWFENVTLLSLTKRMKRLRIEDISEWITKFSKKRLSEVEACVTLFGICEWWNIKLNLKANTFVYSAEDIFVVNIPNSVVKTSENSLAHS